MTGAPIQYRQRDRPGGTYRDLASPHDSVIDLRVPDRGMCGCIICTSASGDDGFLPPNTYCVTACAYSSRTFLERCLITRMNASSLRCVDVSHKMACRVLAPLSDAFTLRGSSLLSRCALIWARRGPMRCHRAAGMQLPCASKVSGASVTLETSRLNVISWKNRWTLRLMETRYPVLA
jgi:hypothetical protein